MQQASLVQGLLTGAKHVFTRVDQVVFGRVPIDSQGLRGFSLSFDKSIFGMLIMDSDPY